MTRPLVATKLYVPRPRRGVVVRPRLLDRLGDDARLTLVSAPAGFGKTTLLAAWLADAAMMTMTTGGGLAVARRHRTTTRCRSGPGSLTALHGAVPERGRAAPRAARRQPRRRPTRSSRTLLNELAHVPRRGVAGARRLPPGRQPCGRARGSPSCSSTCRRRCTSCISTRADPDLPLARWRVRGELVEVRAADLRFTSEEATAYLNAATGLRLGRRAGSRPGGTDRGLDRGAAARRPLAAGARRRRRLHRPVRRGRPLHRRLPRRGGAAPTSRPPVRDFLLHTAVLDRLTGPLCDAVTGRDDAGAMLPRPGARQPLPRGPGRPAGVVPLPPPVRRRAAGAAAQRAARPGAACCTGGPAAGTSSTTCPRQAVQHALAAQDFDRARRTLVELAVPEIRRHRQEAVLAAGSPALPDDAVRRSPVLSVFYGCMLHGLRRPRGGRGPTRRRRTRAGAAPAAHGIHPGPTPTSCGRCRRPSPSTGPRSPRPGRRRRAPPNTPGARSTWPAPTTISRGAVRPGFLGLAAWARGDVHERAGDVHAGGGEPARGRQPRRRAEQHGRARRHVARGRSAGQGPRALPAGAGPRRGARRAGGAGHRRAARGR